MDWVFLSEIQGRAIQNANKPIKPKNNKNQNIGKKK